MAKKKPVLTEREVRLARAFLRAIGGNQANGYLLLAVIAWTRAQGKAHDPFWKSLSRLSAVAAGKKLAERLRAKATQSPKEYKGLLRRLRDVPYSDAGQISQARDFMLSLELSKYDKHHYGYKAFVAGHWETIQRRSDGGHLLPPEQVWVPDQNEQDPLAVIWSGLTGYPIPPKWFTDTVAPAKTPPTVPPVAHQPRSLRHVLPKPDYIQPYAAVNFYEERPHLGDNILPGD